MTDDYQQSSEWAKQHRESLTTRHTHEDVLTDREFELLLEACSSLPEPQDLQTRFVCLAAGRLGLRAGEISHFHAEWLDWDRMLLRIPQHESCECGYCRRQATQETTHNEDLTHEEAMDARWHPKTVASARSIPIDLSLRLELCLERFTDQYDSFPRSRSAVNRRVTADATTVAIAAALWETGSAGADVTVVTPDRSLDDRFAADPVAVFVMSEDNPADSAGRALMVDDRTVLLAAETDDDPVEEEALWTGDSSIGRILAAFMRSGMESGQDRHGE